MRAGGTTYHAASVGGDNNDSVTNQKTVFKARPPTVLTKPAFVPHKSTRAPTSSKCTKISFSVMGVVTSCAHSRGARIYWFHEQVPFFI